MDTIDTLLSIRVLCLAFLAILFLQSGMDKVVNYKGNFEWLKGHFAKSPLKKLVGLMVPMITLLELSAGFLSALGIFFLITEGAFFLAVVGAQLSTLSVLALFFGQRLAQDYEGAASLTTYFIVCVFTLYILHV